MPTLVLDDGRPLGESGAIIWYLGGARASCRRTPTSAAQVLQWMFFEQYDHEPNIAVARFWLEYSGDPAQYADGLPALHEGGYKALGAMERRLDGTRVPRRRAR